MGSSCTSQISIFQEISHFCLAGMLLQCVFYPCWTLLIASQLLVSSQLNCCNSLIFWLHLQSIQELYAAALLLNKVFYREQQFYKIICWFWREQLAQDLLHPLSAVKEEDRAQIAVQDNGRTLSVRSSQFWHLLEAVWGLWGGGC